MLKYYDRVCKLVKRIHKKDRVAEGPGQSISQDVQLIEGLSLKDI